MAITFFGGRSSDGTARPATWAALKTVRAYWESLRGAHAALPARSAVDPRGLAPALDHVFVAERIGTGLIRLRISGMGLADLAGLDMKGLPLSTLFLPEARLRLASVVERVFTQPLAAELHLEAERTIGRPALEARLLMLPLLSSRGECELVLGCLATAGQIGRAPRRFAIARVIEERLVVPQRPLPVIERPAPAMTPGLAEAPAPAPIQRGSHLRLVHSAD